MKPIRHLFAATDLSETSLHAVDRGFQLAHDCGAQYTVMHALGLDALTPLRTLLGDKAADVTRKLREHQLQRLQAVIEAPQRSQGVAARLVIEEGLPTAVVPSCAVAAGADLVVVGATGESLWRRLVLGSTASRLIRKSHCPVLVVKNPGRSAYRRALIAVDFSPVSVAAVRLLKALAPEADLLLLNVFELPFEGMLRYAGVSQAEMHHYQAEAHQHALHGLHQLAARAGLQTTDYRALAKHGSAVGQILAQALHARCDLVVMGKHGTHVTEELLLGSVTKRVLSESDLDLLVAVEAAPE